VNLAHGTCRQQSTGGTRTHEARVRTGGPTSAARALSTTSSAQREAPGRAHRTAVGSQRPSARRAARVSFLQSAPCPNFRTWQSWPTPSTPAWPAAPWSHGGAGAADCPGHASGDGAFHGQRLERFYRRGKFLWLIVRTRPNHHQRDAHRQACSWPRRRRSRRPQKTMFVMSVWAARWRRAARRRHLDGRRLMDTGSDAPLQSSAIATRLKWARSTSCRTASTPGARSGGR
jgi:hypothetical protein